MKTAMNRFNHHTAAAQAHFTSCRMASHTAMTMAELLVVLSIILPIMILRITG